MLDFLPRIYLDFASFWIGAIIAVIALILYIRLKPRSAEIQEWIREKFASLQESLTSQASQRLRQQTLTFAQKQHLSAAFCPLDDILIPPRILASPHQLSQDGLPPDLSTLQDVLPFTADRPEFSAEYQYPTLSLKETLQNGANLALLGRPGSGKTVALAHLTSQILRGEINYLQNWEPLFIDANDLALHLPNEELIPTITDALLENDMFRQAGQLDDLVLSFFQEERAFLIIDNLDQLPRQETILVTTFIKAILKKFSWIRLVTTASIEYFNGLLETDLVPSAVAGWGTKERAYFTERWMEVYLSQGDPAHESEVKTGLRGGEGDLLAKNWLFSNKTNSTPLAFTLQIWGMVAGDSSGARADQGIEAYLQRMTTPLPTSPLPQLQKMAIHILVSNSNVFSRSAIQDNKPAHQDQPSTIGGLPSGDVLRVCRDAGILSETKDRKYRFKHPTFAGFLAASALKQPLSDHVASTLREKTWATAAETYRFSGLNQEIRSQLLRSKNDNKDLLAPDLLRRASMLHYLPQDSKLAEQLRKEITRGILKTPLLETKLRLSCILASSGDPDAESIFRYFLKSPEIDIVQIGILGCGYLRSTKSAAAIIDLLGEHILSDIAACFALVQIGSKDALESVANFLLTGDEKLRQAAAEALANHPREGHPTLKDASELDKLTVRHASVFGLRRIRQPWARDILDELKIEDKEWLVRNAAQQASEVFRGNSPFIPDPNFSKDDLPWIQKYLKHGESQEGNNQVSYQSLLNVLREGTPEQKISALTIIRNEGFGSVFPFIYHNLFQDPYAVRRAAADTLWHLSLTGMDVPPPAGDESQ